MPRGQSLVQMNQPRLWSFGARDKHLNLNLEQLIEGGFAGAFIMTLGDVGTARETETLLKDVGCYIWMGYSHWPRWIWELEPEL